ncbi:baseplate assembly protein [Sphingopyxis yananensis]|uniref:baseplate assembly protein n=1 Tax=Sphingopyxis yananensis TaxID=2886687 RepID=UPI001D114032|nr:baseplate J/gp47 family protein [Sphingopyxis yananensis]MCC2602747.1 baseplate J/gp47 family protein [Sphingopyxis yananensis]
MTDSFTAIDISKLPSPDLIEQLSFEEILTANIAAVRAIIPDFFPRESGPITAVLQAFSYREQHLRQRINDAARAVMVAHAMGSDLDNLAAVFGVARFLISEAVPDQGIAAVWESDEDFRRRIVLAPEGYSVAGPEGAYIYHALSADARVLDASAISPDPGEVLVTILSRDGNGTAAPDLVAAVLAYLSAETRRPLTDYVRVQSAQIITYAVEAELTTFSGPDSDVVLAEAARSLADYISSSFRMGRDITISGLHRALHVAGVQNVRLISPAADLVIDRTQAAYCTGTTIRHVGIGE